MPALKIATGVVHSVPDDLREVLTADVKALERWESLTPLARNEWLCWVEDATKSDTQNKRIARVSSDINDGKRRPCCWPGCSHRKKNGKANA